jgi:exopolyphosphatase/guanosine-5'-triphosphate,3'-diphosphate pyrophosphatase
MRLGVLDVGSNTIHLQVVDAYPGARPAPTTNYKVELRLAEFLNSEGAITQEGIDQLFAAIFGAVEHAKEFKTEEILAFATSAIREATNGAKIISDANEKFELDLQILSGDEEAGITFLAARRWLGWSSGKLLVVDIGGGSLECAIGVNEAPDKTFSLPLGAARLTRTFLNSDPYSKKSLNALHDFVMDTIEKGVPEDFGTENTNRFVATSKTLRTLARICSQWYGGDQKFLDREALLQTIPRLSELKNSERAQLPGVSEGRARQLVAGATVAYAIMETLNIEKIEICPWALREGLVLKWLDWHAR